MRRRDEQLAVALAAGATRQAAADAAGCSLATVARRLADPGFRALVDEHRQAMTEDTRRRLAGLCAVSADKLAAALESDMPPAALVSAFRAVHELSLKHAELADVEARLVDLERRAGLRVVDGGAR